MQDMNNWQSKFSACCYSDKLLDKLSKMSDELNTEVDLTEVKKAIYYARKYHGTQTRQSGEPYYSHPIEVAIIVSNYLCDTDIIVTSILHDTIEDTKLTKEMIATIFGGQVAEQVDDLTRDKVYGKISSAELVRLLWSEKKYRMLLVKQCDRLHNMQTIKAKSPEKIKKIVEETLSNYMSLAIYLNTPKIEHMLAQLCELAMHSQSAELTCDNQDHDTFLLPSLISKSKILHIHNLMS